MAKAAKKKTAVKEEKREKAAVSEQFISPVMRASFPHVHKPDTEGQYSSGKYVITGFLPKEREAELKKMKMACLEAARQFWPKIKLSELEHPIHDGDESDKDTYAGCLYMKASSSRKPGVVGPDKGPLEEGQEIYGGCYFRFSGIARTYTRSIDVIEKVDGKRTKSKEDIKGVNFLINNVQFVKDGERLGGGSSPEEDFDEVDPADWDDMDEDEEFDENDDDEAAEADEDIL